MPLTMCVNALIDEAVDPNVRPRSNIEYGLIKETQICASLDVGIHQIDDRRPKSAPACSPSPSAGMARSSTRSVSPVARVGPPLQAEGASSMVAHSALSFTSFIRSSTRLAHSKKAAGRSEEVPTLSTQRAKLVSPCSKLVRLHRLTFGEEVTNELDQTMTVGALFEARVGDRKRADFCNPEPRGAEAWYKGSAATGDEHNAPPRLAEPSSSYPD